MKGLLTVRKSLNTLRDEALTSRLGNEKSLRSSPESPRLYFYLASKSLLKRDQSVYLFIGKYEW